jgi:hypothetical protein
LLYINPLHNKKASLWRPERIGYWLACSTYASPSNVYSVRGYEGRMVGKLELKGGGLRIWPLDIYIYIFTRRRRAERARVVATLRSEGPSTYQHPLPHQNRAGRRLNAMINWAVAVAMHARSGCNPIAHYITKTQHKQTGGNWQLATGWRVAASEASSKHQKQEPRRRSGQAAPPGACRVSTAHCLCVYTVHWHRHQGQGAFVGSRSTCAAAAALRLAAHPSLQVAAAARAVGGRDIGAPLAMLSS